MLDYIIVGLGLSGMAVAEELEKRGEKFVVFDDHSQNSSYVAGGIFNPVILKRFTLAWKAHEQMQTAIPFYKALENKLGLKLINTWNIYRRFHSAEEQNEWFTAIDKPSLAAYLDPQLKRNTNPNLIADYSFGKVRRTGNIDTESLLKEYIEYLKKQSAFKNERFEYSELKTEKNFVKYKDIKASRIIFCEGFGLKLNPFFNYLPLNGNKGEYMTIYSEDLKLDFVVKSSVFLMPLGNDLYKAGATYNNHDKTKEITIAAKERLIKELKKFIKCDFEVIDQVAGIRPSVIDRRPITGQHPEFSRLYCCNGFGSRGVLIAPSLAKGLLDNIENDKPLDPDADLARFTSKFYDS